ncbi:MAG: CinA family nicotinamide mononucleotide deamidase-related protein [Phycisphaerales bacterium]
MNAVLLSIGDELIIGQTLDTNAAWMAAALLERGVVTIEHRTLPDDRARIAAAISASAAIADLVLITGGLGPTDDDLTRPAVGDVSDPGHELVVDDVARAGLLKRFADRSMASSNLRQAQRPASARCLDNEHGTAPGLAVRIGAADVVAFPGPPREMQPMFERELSLILAARDVPPAPVTVVQVCAAGIGESDAAERLGELMERGGPVTVGTTASKGILSARIRATGASAEAAAKHVAAAVRAAWGPYVFGDGSRSLPATVGDALAARGRTIVTAESCTGGGIGAALTGVPGSSAWFYGGWITYDNVAKESELGVSAEAIEADGAVSHVVAEAMALGALRRGSASDAVAVTGIAGPGGAVPGKPVGTVWIAVASRGGGGGDSETRIRARRFRFPGARDVVQRRTIVAALTMVWLGLVERESWAPQPPEVPLLFEEPISAVDP